MGGKPAHFFLDERYQRIFVIDYLNELIKVVDIKSETMITTLTESNYPVFCSFSEQYVIVSDFWGHKIDFYDRSAMTYSHSVRTKNGPAYSLVKNDLLYFVSQRDYSLQVLDIERKGVFQEFSLSGRVPVFYIYDDLVILPYYDNYHTWSRDYELQNSLCIINLSTLYRWDIEGMVKKPLSVLRLNEGQYAISGYLDNGIYQISWGDMETKTLVQWQNHTHILDMTLWGDYILVPSMSEEKCFVYNHHQTLLKEIQCAKGVLDIEVYYDDGFLLLSNFDEVIQLYSNQFQLLDEQPVGQYPIKMLIHQDRVYVLCMDSGEINVFQLVRD
ncbi:MAG TPA: hypothetical protein P5107_03280 [Thermotogota bacterium]|nr:hypothetical protein [Thermotogota bacterium]HRW34061.1 hypothetical protein [Thermotogota bacterium]